MTDKKYWKRIIIAGFAATILLVAVIFIENTGYLSYLLYPVGTTVKISSSEEPVSQRSTLSASLSADSREQPSSQTVLPVTASMQQASSEASQSIATININTANLDELCALPGIGKVIAQNIINYRTANGVFKTIDELIEVNRIGPVVLEKIRAYITVN